jgi:2-methylcitrate dehydratase PrpD
MSLVGQMAEFVTGAQASTLPALDQKILRIHAADVALARILGGHCFEGQHLRRVFAGSGAEGIAGIAGLVRMTEMDDIHTGSNITPSAVTVPTAFCLYPQNKRDPQEIASAIYVGTELMVRFGKAMDGAKALFQGFWPTRSAAALGACAVACRLWGLNLERTREALSLSIMTSAGKSGRFLREPSGRWIVFANAVATGLRMAEAARQGFNGSENVPDGEWIGTAFGLPFDANELTQDLEAKSIFPELSLKPFATARQALGATQALLSLRTEGLDPMQIEKIVARVPTSHKAMISQPLLASARGSAFVSGAAQLATAALLPNDLYDVERRNILGNPQIADLASRIVIEGSPELDREFPKIWAAEVEVTAAGHVLRRSMRDSLGSPENRMDTTDLLHKARCSLDWFSQSGRAESLIALSNDMFESQAAALEISTIFEKG